MVHAELCFPVWSLHVFPVLSISRLSVTVVGILLVWDVNVRLTEMTYCGEGGWFMFHSYALLRRYLRPYLLEKIRRMEGFGERADRPDRPYRRPEYGPRGQERERLEEVMYW